MKGVVDRRKRDGGAVRNTPMVLKPSLLTARAKNMMSVFEGVIGADRRSGAGVDGLNNLGPLA